MTPSPRKLARSHLSLFSAKQTAALRTRAGCSKPLGFPERPRSHRMAARPIAGKLDASDSKGGRPTLVERRSPAASVGLVKGLTPPE